MAAARSALDQKRQSRARRHTVRLRNRFAHHGTGEYFETPIEVDGSAAAPGEGSHGSPMAALRRAWRALPPLFRMSGRSQIRF